MVVWKRKLRCAVWGMSSAELSANAEQKSAAVSLVDETDPRSDHWSITHICVSTAPSRDDRST